MDFLLLLNSQPEAARLALFLCNKKCNNKEVITDLLYYPRRHSHSSVWAFLFQQNRNQDRTLLRYR